MLQKFCAIEMASSKVYSIMHNQARLANSVMSCNVSASQQPLEPILLVILQLSAGVHQGAKFWTLLLQM
jgi:hypothetical protein